MYAEENKQIKKAFAQALCRGRTQAGWTQQWVAEVLDRSCRWVQKLESGASEPNLADTLRLMALYDLQAGELVGSVCRQQTG